VIEPLNYSLQDIVIPEASRCKYLGIILRSDLIWAEQVNYTVKKAWKALHFTMCILEKGNSNTKKIAYTSLVCTEYGVACWDPHREGNISALDWAQRKAAKLVHHRNDSKRETLAQSRNIARICALFKAHMGEWAWKAIGDRLLKPCYLSRVNHDGKNGSRR
jgi:hypothetical protein